MIPYWYFFPLVIIKDFDYGEMVKKNLVLI